MKLFKKVAIIGVGLIGGSLGLAIKKKKLADKVIGIGHHKNSINEALRIKAIDEGYLNLDKARGADLIVIATPVSSIIDILPKLKKIIHKDSIVIDAGSTKFEIINLARHLNIDFIGCHPLAGSEKKGPINADSAIFKNSICVIVPLDNTKKRSLLKIRKLWTGVGARTKVLSPGKHDRILAFVSHLPHAAVFSLIDSVDKNYFEFASSGLKDTTRIGQSDERIWRDIFLSNRNEVLFAINKFKKSLERIESLIRKKNLTALESYIKKAKDKRNEL